MYPKSISTRRLYPLILALSFSIPALGESDSTQSKSYEDIELFQKVYHLVLNNYVDKVDSTKLIQGAIKGMLSTLDLYSSYLNEEAYRELKTETAGKFGGVGIEVSAKGDSITIVSAMPDTPAEKAGIKSGDKIISIDGKSIKNGSVADAIKGMRGKIGSVLKLSVTREGESKPLDFELKRELIRIKSLESKILADAAVYVKLVLFNEHAARDIKQAILNLTPKSKPNIPVILDLRGNPGGLLEQAVEVVSLFMDDGVVVSTVTRDPSNREVRNVKKGSAIFKDRKLFVLVDGGSASASEIVAGALQDHKRALLFGSKTFGKGSVQTISDLSKDTGLKLTIAKYFTPSNRSIHEVGIQPDVVLDSTQDSLKVVEGVAKAVSL